MASKENSDKIETSANLVLTPIVRRTSSYYGKIDTISVYSESTLPSELVEKQIEEYRMQQRAQAIETEEFERNNNVQYNLRFDKVLIVGGAGETKDGNFEEPMAHAVNDILANRIDFDKIERECILRNQTRWQKVQNYIYNKRVGIPIIILLLVLICGLSYTTYYFISYNMSLNKNGEDSQALKSHKLVKREDWQSKDEDSMQLTGKFKIIAPVSKIIVLKTETDMCSTEESCMSFMLEHQQNAYPKFDDIRENFIIAEDGTVFEGRGFIQEFMREGEATCENDMITCYNKNAISIAFVLNSTKMNDNDENRINEEQYSAFCELIRNYTDEQRKIIDKSFNVFHHDNLISSATFDLKEYNLLNDCIHSFYNVPEIEKQTSMIDLGLVDDSLIRQLSRSVLVKSTNGNFCGSKENCQEIIDKLKKPSANFIIGGENNFIFADNNFDLAVSESLYDTLVMLFIGNYATNQPSQSLITEVFSRFLEYASVLDKLSMNYTICVTNEATQLTNGIKAKFPTRYENFCNS